MWTLISTGGNGSNYGQAHKEFMLDNENDISSEPNEYGSIAPGSIAYLSDMSKLWQKDANEDWIEIQGGGGSGGAGFQSDWNQNDETAKDYIKNRPGGYVKSVENKLVSSESYTVAINSLLYDDPDFFCDNPSTYHIKDEIINCEALTVELNGEATKLKNYGSHYSSTVQADLIIYGNNSEVIDNYLIQGDFPSGDPETNMLLWINQADNSSFKMNFLDSSCSTVYFDTGDSIAYDSAAIEKINQLYTHNADWNQNNPDGDGYVKNRPGGYMEISFNTEYENVVTDTSGTIAGSSGSPTCTEDFDTDFVEGSIVQLVVGNKVFDETTVDKQSNFLMFGNKQPRGGPDNGLPYAVWYNSVGNIYSLQVDYVSGKSSWTPTIGEQVQIKFKKPMPQKIPAYFVEGGTTTEIYKLIISIHEDEMSPTGIDITANMSYAEIYKIANKENAVLNVVINDKDTGLKCGGELLFVFPSSGGSACIFRMNTFANGTVVGSPRYFVVTQSGWQENTPS